MGQCDGGLGKLFFNLELLVSDDWGRKASHFLPIKLVGLHLLTELAEVHEHATGCSLNRGRQSACQFVVHEHAADAGDIDEQQSVVFFLEATKLNRQAI